jgi:hypothetical protein
MGDTESFNKNDNEKLIIKTKFQSQRIFRRDYNGDEIDIFHINQYLANGNFDSISEQFFIKGFTE